MEKQKNKKPLIRFPEFKDGWSHVKLSELLKESKKRNEDLKYDKDKVLSVSGEFGIVNQIEHLGRSYAGVSVHNYHVVEKGDIVYTKSPLKENPFGIIKLNKGEPGIVSTLYAVYNVKKENALGEYLDYYFSLDANTNRYLRPLVKKGAKNDMKINNAYVLHDRIFVPSLNEQKRIVTFFSALEKKIGELKQKKQLLEQYKKGIVSAIFQRELQLKNKESKKFAPWKETTLGKLGETFTGLSGKTKEDFGTGKRYIQYKQVFGNSRIDISQCDYVEIKEGENQNQVRFGDVIFTTSSETPLEVGFSSVLLDEVEEVYLNSFCFGFRINSFDELSPYFAQYLFRSPDFRKAAIKLGQGSTRYNMSKTELMKTPIVLPCIDEQKTIYAFLNTIDSKISTVNSQIAEITIYRKGLLQNMFCADE